MAGAKLSEVHGIGTTRRLQTRQVINAPINTVWEAITLAEHVSQWWAEGSIGSKAGEPMRLGGEEDVNGTIITHMAPHIFQFTWHDKPEEAEHPEWIEPHTLSLVHFDLIETAPDATMVTLVSFSPVTSATGAAAGWHHLFEALQSYVETGEYNSPPDRFEQLKALYA